MSARASAAPTTGEPEARARVAAPVLEVFASIQGEGAFAGEAQTFVRLRGCPLRCRWCDTPGSWTLHASDRARIAAHEGTRREEAWATPFQVACWVAEVEPGSPRTVSLTGGEPLVWPEFVSALKGMIGTRRLHLETAGAHPRTLARVIDRCDHISLDLKPDLDLDPPLELDTEPGLLDTEPGLLDTEPGLLDTVPGLPETVPGLPDTEPGLLDAAPALLHAAPGHTDVVPGLNDERVPTTRAQWKSAREECLRLVAGRDACGKIVVSGLRDALDFAGLLDEVEACASGLRLFLQPATPCGGVPAPSPELVLAVCEMARDRDLDVRVVPQLHRTLGLP